MLIPRAGFELGSRVLFRAGLELPVYKRIGGMDEAVRGLAMVAGAPVGIGFSLGVGVGF